MCDALLDMYTQRNWAQLVTTHMANAHPELWAVHKETHGSPCRPD